jgi:hypothetical protein
MLEPYPTLEQGRRRPIPWFAWGPMEAGVRIDDLVQKTVVFIGSSPNGIFVPAGTGFVTVSLYSETVAWQSVITARHVIESVPSDIVTIRLNMLVGGACTVKTKKDEWVFHPNQAIDLAACPTYLAKDYFDDVLHFVIVNRDSERENDPAWMECVLTDEITKEQRVGVGDEIHITGMFVSHIGETRNRPIVRIGTIAAMPDEPLETTYGTHDAFLVEVRSIDGLSGSPVCIDLQRRELPHSMPARPLPHPLERRRNVCLVGVVLGYNGIVNPNDTLEIKDERDSSLKKTWVPMNTGIAVVLPARYIAETTEQPAMAEIRAKVLSEYNKGNSRRFVPTAAEPIGMKE